MLCLSICEETSWETCCYGIIIDGNTLGVVKYMKKRNPPFVIAEDKVDEFIQETADEEIIKRIYDMAEKFEKKIEERE